MRSAPFISAFAANGMVCSVDHLASGAGVEIMRAGGNAVDAAVAASAVLSVTCQHVCGMGGDLFALVHEPGSPAPWALNASGRSGSGADLGGILADGFTSMPATGDIRSVPVPGCVDGWTTLHARGGRLPLAHVLAPAAAYAAEGFPASPLLAAAAHRVAGLPGGEPFAAATRPGAIVRRPKLAATLSEIGRDGRDAFYLGPFGEGLRALGKGEYVLEDVQGQSADWTNPLGLDVWGRTIWTVPPNSQGYLTLAAARIAAGLDLGSDADDATWAHYLIESARAAGFDRPSVLHDGADGAFLISEERLAPRRQLISADRASGFGGSYREGGTMFLCAVDSERRGVSLIQSNAMGFGALIAEPSTGIFLHNRGIGFSVETGHPAAYGPRRRPPHTLAPALVTGPDGALDTVVGTMGGDAQPQIVLQLLARLLVSGEAVGDAVAAPRWVLQSTTGGTGFDTWHDPGQVAVALEAGSPPDWAAGLAVRGHRLLSGGGSFGHAHAIRNHGEFLEGAADPRSLAGSAAGY